MTAADIDMNVWAKRHKTRVAFGVFYYAFMVVFPVALDKSADDGWQGRGPWANNRLFVKRWQFRYSGWTFLQQFMLALPLVYLVCRFQAVLDMRDKHVRFSELFCATLALFLSFLGFDTNIPMNPAQWDAAGLALHNEPPDRASALTQWVQILLLWLAPLWMWLVHRASRRQGETGRSPKKTRFFLR